VQHDGTGDDDAFAELARIKARRAMADLAGFNHDPAWDEQERAALERLRIGSAPAAPEPTGPPSDDPLADLARVAALRHVADEMGLRHDPAWDREEADVARQLHEQGPDPAHG
jgi:hypothetical protein